MNRTAFLGYSLLLMVLLVPTLAWAQADGDVYTAYFIEQDLAKKVVLGEQFLAQFKTSQYTDAVYRQTVSNYYKLNNFPKVLALAQKLDEFIASSSAANKAQIYTLAMEAARQSNSTPQMLAFGEKVLTFTPEDIGPNAYINTLITLASTLSSAPAAEKASWDKAEGYAAKGLTVLEKLKGADVGMSDPEWAKQKVGIEGNLHFTIGSIHYNKMDYDGAAESLTKGTQATPKDGAAWYMLGLAINQQYQAAVKKYTASVEKANGLIRSRADQLVIAEAQAESQGLQEVAYGKRDEAIEALATSVALGGTTQQPAKAQLDRLFSAKNNGSTNGVEQLIATKQAWVKTLP